MTYSQTSTISLSFWLNWFLDIISEVNVTRGHGSNLNHPTFKVKYLTSMHIHTSSLTNFRVKRGVKVYNISIVKI